MSDAFLDVLKSSAVIKNKLKGFFPEILLVLGSGLGDMAEEIENPVYVPYRDCPGFKTSTAPGHMGRFVFGYLRGKRVVAMQGRLHAYEGYTMEEIVYPIRVCQVLGVRKMIVTNAAGAINTDFHIGDIMLITDHIKFCFASPLMGTNIPEIGTRFPDMTYAYNRELNDIARQAAKNVGLDLKEGTYMFFGGPQFETPAEIRAARVLGADAAGMSTVPEVIACAHAGIKVVGFSLLCNMAAGVQEVKLMGSDVDDAAKEAGPKFRLYMEELIDLI